MQNTKTLFLLRINFTTTLTFLTLKFSKKWYFLENPFALRCIWMTPLSRIGTYFSNASRPKLNHAGRYILVQFEKWVYCLLFARRSTLWTSQWCVLNIFCPAYYDKHAIFTICLQILNLIRCRLNCTKCSNKQDRRYSDPKARNG